MVERRQAPKQKILSINRVGAWGKVRYEHRLECGHAEILPRASTATRIACTWCVKAQEKEEELKQLISPQKNSLQILDMEEFMSQDEIEVNRTRASIAAMLQIPVDAVSIVSTDVGGRLVVKSAYIFLSSGDITRILTKGENNG